MDIPVEVVVGVISALLGGGAGIGLLRQRKDKEAHSDPPRAHSGTMVRITSLEVGFAEMNKKQDQMMNTLTRIDERCEIICAGRVKR